MGSYEGQLCFFGRSQSPAWSMARLEKGRKEKRDRPWKDVKKVQHSAWTVHVSFEKPWSTGALEPALPNPPVPYIKRMS